MQGPDIEVYDRDSKDPTGKPQRMEQALVTARRPSAVARRRLP